MNISLYPQLKGAGLVTLSKIGTAHKGAAKQFLVDFGTETTPLTESLDIPTLKAHVDKLKLELDAYQLLIADLKALP